MIEKLEEEIPRLTKFAQRLCKDDNTADDLVQTTLLKAIEKQDQYKPGTNLRNWLMTILYNSYVDHKRKYHFRQVLDPNAPEIEDNAPTGTREASVLEAAFIETLDETDMQIAVLFSKGFHRKEIAEIMGINAHTIGSKFQRLRARAKDYIERRTKESE